VQALGDLRHGRMVDRVIAEEDVFANGKGGLDAEEIARVVGPPIGSRVLVDILISLQLKQLLACVHTDEHEQRRKLYYLTKEVKVA
jgi:hypothetical protein